jgi:hypothetical protein
MMLDSTSQSNNPPVINYYMLPNHVSDNANLECHSSSQLGMRGKHQPGGDSFERSLIQQ